MAVMTMSGDWVTKGMHRADELYAKTNRTKRIKI